MSTNLVLKFAGVVLVCLGLHYGLSSVPWLLVFGSGLGFLFFP